MTLSMIESASGRVCERRRKIRGLSERAAARHFGIDPRTVSKMLKFSVPPDYRRSKPPVRPKLDPFNWVWPGVIKSTIGLD